MSDCEHKEVKCMECCRHMKLPEQITSETQMVAMLENAELKAKIMQLKMQLKKIQKIINKE